MENELVMAKLVKSEKLNFIGFCKLEPMWKMKHYKSIFFTKK